MARVWIVQAKFQDGSWSACDFSDHQYVATNYYEAHQHKREIQAFLYDKGSIEWTKNKFRVKEYREI